MELLHPLRHVFTRPLAITLGFWLAFRQIGLDGQLPGPPILYAIGASITIGIFNDLFLYPYLLDPLRKLPTYFIVDFRELLPVTDVPRGKKTLKWVTENPGADLININVFPGSRALIVVSPQAHRDVHQTHAADFQKPPGAINFLADSLGYGLILSEGEVHKRQRRIITPSFRIQNLRSLHPLIAEKTALMLKCIEQEMSTKNSIEIAGWGSRATMDIIGPALMSKDFQSLTTTGSQLEVAYHNLIETSPGLAWLFASSLILPMWIVRRIPTEKNKIVQESALFIQDVCRKILAEKKEPVGAAGRTDEEEATADILGSIRRNGELTNDEIVDQMMTFLAAGHETTASSIAWAAHLLTLPQYSRYQAQLRDEIDHAVSQHGAIPAEGQEILPYTTLEALPLLNGICEEVLRLYPPVTNTGRLCTRDTVVAGHKISKNELLVISPWAINRNPEFWGSNAGEMVPERWIDELPDGSRRANKSGGAPSNMCIQTFLHGNRACIGKDLARAELRYMLAAMLWKYQLNRLPGDNGEVVPAGSLTIKPAGGLQVTVTPWDRA